MVNRNTRRAKIRKTIRGEASRPRLVVFRSNRYLYAQIVDDTKATTLLSTDRNVDPVSAGKQLAEKAAKKKIQTVVFDRAGYKYHGNIKKFAEAAREAGLRF